MESLANLLILIVVVELIIVKNVTINLPEVATTLEFTQEVYTFTMEAYVISKGETSLGQETGKSYCGTQETAGASGSACVMSITTTVTLPIGVQDRNMILSDYIVYHQC